MSAERRPLRTARHRPMGWTEFAASVIGDVLSWPVVALIVVLLLLKPIRKLIGRVRTAQGFGAKFQFSERLQSLEENVDEARAAEKGPTKVADAEDRARQDSPADPDGGIQAGEWNPEPSSDPSGAIIGSWEQLAKTLEELSRSTAGPGRPAQKPEAIIDQLRRNAGVSGAFHKSATDLLELRNQVAHGEVVPTQGAARTYVDRAAQLQTIARGMIHVEKMDLSKTLLDPGP